MENEIQLLKEHIVSLQNELMQKQVEFEAAKNALFEVQKSAILPIYAPCKMYLCGDNTMTLIASLNTNHVIIVGSRTTENDIKDCDLKAVSNPITGKKPLNPF